MVILLLLMHWLSVSQSQLNKSLTNQDENIRIAAVAALGEIGSSSVLALPALSKLLKDNSEDVRIIVVDTLEKIGKPAVPVLIQALQNNDNWMVRYSAADALGRIGASDQEVVPVLINALRDKDEYVRSEAADVLGKIGKMAVPDLINALQSKDAYVRYKAVDALRIIGKEAVAALPALRNALHDEDIKVSLTAKYAIDAINAASNPTPMQVTKEENPLVRYEAIRERIECKDVAFMDNCNILSFYVLDSRSRSSTQNSTYMVGQVTSNYVKELPVMCRIPVLRRVFRWKCL
jgi:HEAT repeat protein